MTKTNPNGKLLLTKIFGGLIRLSWCWYICLSYCANLSRTQLENASQKLHAIWLISTRLPSLCLSWMALLPQEWQQLGFLSPSYWNSFRGRKGRTVNGSSCFRLFPSSGSHHEETYSLCFKHLQVYRSIQNMWVHTSTLSGSIAVSVFQYRNNSWYSPATAVFKAIYLTYSPSKPFNVHLHLEMEMLIYTMLDSALSGTVCTFVARLGVQHPSK